MNTPDSLYDIAIVGLGPVGVGAAILLAHEGLRVVALERATEVYDLPRAVVLDGEVLRAFQRIGLGERLASVIQPPRPNDGAFFADSKHRPMLGTTLESLGHNGWPDAAFIDQPEFERELRAMLAETAGVDTLLGHEVQSIAQGADSVALKARRLDDGAEIEVNARYLIACDGASSFVRRSLGIEWESLGYDQEWLVVDIVVGEDSPLGVPTLQVCDPDRLATYVCAKDPNRRFEFRLKPGESREEMSQPERVRELLDDWIARDSYTLRRGVVYQFHAATAARWREGRIFLAGDAAHQTPPFLGQGLNAGFRDVVNLSWKIPRVLRGEAPQFLLDTYVSERDPHARDLVDWAVAIGRLMEGLAAAEASATAEAGSGETHAGRAIAGAPSVATASAGAAADSDAHAAAPALDTSAAYGQGRSAPPLRSGVLLDRQVGEDSSTGYLLRQPYIRGDDGGERLLDELFGPGFVLLTRAGARSPLSRRSRELLDRIGAKVVSLDGVEVLRGKLDSLFERSEAAIVRPDRYVFGTTDDETSADDLVAALSERLGIATP